MTRIQNLFVVIFVLAIIAFRPQAAAAQTAQGLISGAIIDPTKAVIPGAAISAVNEATGIATHAVTNEAGRHVLAFLTPGRYKIVASMRGFKTYEHPGVQIETSQVLELNIATENRSDGFQFRVNPGLTVRPPQQPVGFIVAGNHSPLCLPCDRPPLRHGAPNTMSNSRKASVK